MPSRETLSASLSSRSISCVMSSARCALSMLSSSCDRRLHLAAALLQQLRHAQRSGRQRLDVEQVHRLGRVLHQVEHVVHAGDQAVDVVAVERRDERGVQQRDRLVRDLVGAALDVPDPLGSARLAASSSDNSRTRSTMAPLPSTCRARGGRKARRTVSRAASGRRKTALLEPPGGPKIFCPKYRRSAAERGSLIVRPAPRRAPP